MDEKTEALIGPEPVIDPAAAQALDREVKEENDELRMKIAGQAFAAFAALFVFVLGPILASPDRSVQLLLWILVSIPLLAFAGRAWRKLASHSAEATPSKATGPEALPQESRS